jgi:hypothetical protein
MNYRARIARRTFPQTLIGLQRRRHLITSPSLSIHLYFTRTIVRWLLSNISLQHELRITPVIIWPIRSILCSLLVSSARRGLIAPHCKTSRIDLERYRSSPRIVTIRHTALYLVLAVSFLISCPCSILPCPCPFPQKDGPMTSHSATGTELIEGAFRRLPRSLRGASQRRNTSSSSPIMPH